MRKTLVTGGTGFIGSAIVRKLIDAGHDVRVLARAGSDRRNLDGLPVEIATGDLTSRRSLDGAVQDCQAVFHVAADYRLWVPRPRDMYEANVTGTVNLMRAAVQGGVDRIVYTSSVAVLGPHPEGIPSDETVRTRLDGMIGHYKRSKFMAEQEVVRLVRKEGLPAVIVNPSTPVGPRDIKPTPTGRLIVEAASGHMPAYVNTGLNLVHVDDVAAGHLLALERGAIGEHYILGAANLELKTILAEVAALTGRRPPRIRLLPGLILPVAFFAECYARLNRSYDPMVTITGVRLARKKMFFSTAKAERELGFRPRPVREALADAIDWFRQNGYIRE